MNNNQSSLMSEMIEAIEEDLQRSAPLFDNDCYTDILQMINFHMGWTDQSTLRGKRIRSLLTLLCYAGIESNWEVALPAASAIEWIHNFSLVHDDVEDQSDTRRGRSTLWKQWGPAKAINVGDTIFVIGRLALYRLIENGFPHDTVLQAQHILDRACFQLTQGQHLDLALETKKETSIDVYIQMIEWKTSALISAATTIGPVIAGASPSTVESYREFGHYLGLAFQILDDILGIWGDPGLTGKPAGDDLLARKKTLPIIYGLGQSKIFADLFSRETEEVELDEFILALEEVDVLKQTRTTAQHYSDKSLEALQKATPSDPAGDTLKQLTHQLLQRPS